MCRCQININIKYLIITEVFQLQRSLQRQVGLRKSSNNNVHVGRGRSVQCAGCSSRFRSSSCRRHGNVAPLSSARADLVASPQPNAPRQSSVRWHAETRVVINRARIPGTIFSLSGQLTLYYSYICLCVLFWWVLYWQECRVVRINEAELIWCS